MEANSRKRRADIPLNLDSNQNKQNKSADKNGYFGFGAGQGKSSNQAPMPDKGAVATKTLDEISSTLPSFGPGSFNEDQRQKIVREVVEDGIAPSALAKKYRLSSHYIEAWVKNYTKSKRCSRKPSVNRSRVGFAAASNLINISDQSSSEVPKQSQGIQPQLSTGSDSYLGSRHQGLEETGLICPIISQEDKTLGPTESGVRAVTLLGKVDFGECVEHVKIIPKMGKGLKLVTGIHRCMGDQESKIGNNNLFLTILIEKGQQPKSVKVGDTVGYAQLIGKNQLMEPGLSKVKLDKDIKLLNGEVAVLELTVESLPLENRKNYPVQFVSNTFSIEVLGDRSTIQKGNSAKVTVKNVSVNPMIFKNGDIFGTAKSLVTKEFIEKIQLKHNKTPKGTSTSNPASVSLDHINSFIFIEIETVRASNSNVKEITQIGCCSSGSKDLEKTFFKVIAPKRLNHYLDSFKMDGDLLQLLHLQKSESGRFEFRKQFEIVQQGVEVPKCTTEAGALLALALFLNSFSAECVLISINKETIELVVERMKHFEIDINFVKGFSTWNSIHDRSIDNDLSSTQDFDDWYNETINNNVSSHLHAEAVAHMHKEAIGQISNDSNHTSVMIRQASFPIESLLTSNASITDPEGPPEFLELFNGFRPSFPATITMSYLETLDISSEDENVPEVSQIPFLDEEILISDSESEDYIDGDCSMSLIGESISSDSTDKSMSLLVGQPRTSEPIGSASSGNFSGKSVAPLGPSKCFANQPTASAKWQNPFKVTSPLSTNNERKPNEEGDNWNTEDHNRKLRMCFINRKLRMCFTCESKFHLETECQFNNSERNEEKDGEIVKCEDCFSEWHKSFQCPWKRHKNPAGLDGKIKRCEICDSVLHLKHDCPHRVP